MYMYLCTNAFQGLLTTQCSYCVNQYSATDLKFIMSDKIPYHTFCLSYRVI